MQEGSVSLFFGSYGLLFYFYGSGFRLARFPGSSSLFVFSGLPVCPFSRASGLPVFPGFRFARFPGFPACSFSLVFRLARFLGLPACLLFLVSGLSVFPGFRFARFFGFPVCSFSRASGLPVFSGFRFACFPGLFSLFSGFSVFFLFYIADFSVFCSVFARWLFCFVRSEGNTQIQCQNRKSLIIRYSSSSECPEMDTF